MSCLALRLPPEPGPEPEHSQNHPRALEGAASTKQISYLPDPGKAHEKPLSALEGQSPLTLWRASIYELYRKDCTAHVHPRLTACSAPTHSISPSMPVKAEPTMHSGKSVGRAPDERRMRNEIRIAGAIAFGFKNPSELIADGAAQGVVGIITRKAAINIRAHFQVFTQSGRSPYT